MLKMLGLYLYTLIIGHKSCSRWSKLNKLLLQKELQSVVKKYVLFGQNIKTQQQQSKNET